MPRTVRLGFVGAGMMGQQAHLANYVGLEGVELVALAEGRRELAAQVARRYGVAETCATHRELAAREDIDAVVAIMWFGLHYGVVRDLLAAGKHVATEKSLCITEPAADALVAAAEQSGKLYQVCYMKRFDPGVRYAVKLIRDLRRGGEAGELRLARIWCSAGDWTWHIEPCLRTDEPVPPYDTEPEPPQPGASEDQMKWVWAWLNYFSHQTNLLRYVLGEDYDVAYHDAWSGGDVVVVHTPSGVRGLLEFHRFTSPGWDEGFEVTFERATVRVRLPAPLARQQAARVEVVWAGERPRIEQPYVEPIWAMRAQAEAFVEAVRGGPKLSPASEAAKEVRLAWRLAQSAHLG